jgi:uncharacterized protein (TIGR02246 family)
MATLEKTQTLISTKEEAAILAEVDAYIEALNSGDTKKSISFFANDAVRIDAFGDVEVGCVAIEAALDNMIHRTNAGAKFDIPIPGDVRMLTPEYAIMRGPFDLVRPNGQRIPGYVTLTYHKEGDRWLIIEANPKYFKVQMVPEPGAGQ